jgi:tetratricopeptide (TPR) repeat protein
MAWVLHQQASVLLEVERPGEAGEVLDQALAHYRAMNDTYGEAQALVARTQALKRLGRLEDALACARQLTALCEQHGHAKPAVAGYLELGRLLVRSGQAREGLAVLREALGKAILQENRNAQFFAHYYLWKAYEGLGDGDRARFEREAARYFVRFLDEPSPEADEVRALPGR